MRLIHLADLHLGFRAYQRERQGINQRELDVAATFSRVIDILIARAPDVVIIAGDVFHTVRPTNTALLHAYREFDRLTTALSEALVVMVAGNHDTPRTSETGSILPLFETLGIHVADSVPKRFRFPERDLSVLAVPDAMHERPTFEADPRSRYNVCVAHLEAAGMLVGRGVQRQRTDLEVPLAEMALDQFQYVGLGHYHVFRQLAPNCCYSGSIEYTSTNPWGEIEEEGAAGLAGKGMVERDLDTGDQTVIPIPPARPLVDLPIIDASALSPQALDVLLAANGATPPDGSVVRQRVVNVPLSVSRALDHKAVRAIRSRLTHYHLVTQKPEAEERKPGGAIVQRPSLAQMLRDVLTRNAAQSDLDPDTVVAAGLDYLSHAESLDDERQKPASTSDIAA